MQAELQYHRGEIGRLTQLVMASLMVSGHPKRTVAAITTDRTITRCSTRTRGDAEGRSCRSGRGTSSAVPIEDPNRFLRGWLAAPNIGRGSLGGRLAFGCPAGGGFGLSRIAAARPPGRSADEFPRRCSGGRGRRRWRLEIEVLAHLRDDLDGTGRTWAAKPPMSALSQSTLIVRGTPRDPSKIAITVSWEKISPGLPPAMRKRPEMLLGGFLQRQRMELAASASRCFVAAGRLRSGGPPARAARRARCSGASWSGSRCCQGA